MSTFLLIRHADNDYVGNTLVGWRPGVHLNVCGREQAEWLAGRLASLPVRALYSSPLERALETAQPIAARLNLAVERVEEIGELRLGDWTGRTLRELESDALFQRFNAQRATGRIPGGETMLEVQSRMLAALERMRTLHPGQMVAAVSHGDPLRAILCHFLGMPLDLLARLEVQPASVSVVAWEDWGARVLRINDRGELP